MAAKQRSSSVAGRGEGETWKCKLCNDVAKDEKAEMLECEYCDEHFCRKCLSMSSSEYKVLTKRTDIHWYCPPCESKALKNLKVEKEVEVRCKEYFDKLEKRIEEMEKKIQSKPNMEDVERLIKESESRVASGGCPDINEQLADMRESESHGLPEAEVEDSEERKKEDVASTNELLDLLEVNPAAASKTFRLGKKPDVPGAKPRPMKIEFKSNGDKGELMKNVKKLANSTGKFASISISHDMTKKEREENKKCVEEARARNESEPSENFKFIVVGPAWERRVVKVKKKKKE